MSRSVKVRVVVAAVVAAGLLPGCGASDDGAGVRTIDEGGSASGTGSATGSGTGSATGDATGTTDS